MKLNWSLGENWKHDHNQITAPRKKKIAFIDCENAIRNSVMINYSWKIRTWNVTFIYLHGKE